MLKLIKEFILRSVTYDYNFALVEKMIKLKLVKPMLWYVSLSINARMYKAEVNDRLLTHARIYMAYDGALDGGGFGRDTDEFFRYVHNGWMDTINYFRGNSSSANQNGNSSGSPRRV